MTRPATIFPEKRRYAKWVNSQTLEDYALRYTAKKARRFSAWRVANTAIGASAFLACEAIGAAITLSFGFANAASAIGAAVVVMFILGLPIAYHAAKSGVDIDLLSRGAGFGYLGSTITSLVYATFTFLLFTVEASIMAIALEAVFDIPLGAAYAFSALIVIPIVIYGMRAITLFQALTQPLWIALQLVPIVYLLVYGSDTLAEWARFAGIGQGGEPVLTAVGFGLAFSTLLSLLPQIGEQADYLRFLPPMEKVGRWRWWAAMLAGGPGWTLFGGVKLMLGSLLAAYMMQAGASASAAQDPTAMFQAVFADIAGDGRLALALTGLFVVVCQLKINVTNAYAGSIAWSNVFARMTYAHPGRVVWIVFNVGIALLLMLVGILDMVEKVLVFYAMIAAGWIGALAGDLMLAKPLGLSPQTIDFKRAHLFDINPVGCGAMALSVVVSLLCYSGVFGGVFEAFAPAVGLATAFAAAPVLALVTNSAFYIARTSPLPQNCEEHECTVCGNTYETPDMAHCPVYSAPICSLCCTLEMRCRDVCKDNSRAGEQTLRALRHVLPDKALALLTSQAGQITSLIVLFAGITAATLLIIYFGFRALEPDAAAVVRPVLWAVFSAFFLLSSIAAFWLVLAGRSRRAAERDAERHVDNLISEVAAHDVTEKELERAREAAEVANTAKSQYLMGVSHEIRAPLNSIFGYAQLLERGASVDVDVAAKAIRRSSQHLSDLVDGLLDISSVENSVMRLHQEPIRFHDFLEQIAVMFQPEATAKGVAFHFSKPDHLPDVVKTDAKRLRQILINLLSNAIKYTQEGSITFDVAYRSQIATFSIIDTGIGISPEEQQRILQPFVRGAQSAPSAAKGIGLGLAIANTLIEIMGGDLAISSTPGVGTRFQVRLMLPEPREAGLPDAKPVAVSGYKGPRRLLLVVDDDPTQRALLTTLLEPLGFDVIARGSGTDGLASARETPPDCCLLDVTLPDMTGWDVAKALRQKLALRAPIIMISADAHLRRQGQDGQSDHDRFLSKPLDMDALIDALGSLLHLEWIEQHQPAQLQSPETDPPPAKLTDAQKQLVSRVIAEAQIGQARAVETSLKALHESGAPGADLAESLDGALQHYDFRAIVKTLEETLAAS
ncbi:MAG: ATP-binding protein [Pseudomonadota bacterium]